MDAGGNERARNRALSTGELARLFEAIRQTPSFGRENLLALRLLLALCVRKAELLGARWMEFDLDGPTMLGPVWHLPGERTKTGEPLDIPLAMNVVGWLRDLQVMAGPSDFVFPRRMQNQRQRASHISFDFDTLNVAMARVKHGLLHFTIHDLRRTARTQLAALGIRREVAERCLGHKLRSVEGTYNRHDYYEERRSALGQWAELVTQAERGSTVVTPFRRIVKDPPN